MTCLECSQPRWQRFPEYWRHFFPRKLLDKSPLIASWKTTLGAGTFPLCQNAQQRINTMQHVKDIHKGFRLYCYKETVSQALCNFYSTLFFSILFISNSLDRSQLVPLTSNRGITWSLASFLRYHFSQTGPSIQTKRRRFIRTFQISEQIIIFGVFMFQSFRFSDLILCYNTDEYLLGRFYESPLSRVPSYHFAESQITKWSLPAFII